MRFNQKRAGVKESDMQTDGSTFFTPGRLQSEFHLQHHSLFHSVSLLLSEGSLTGLICLLGSFSGSLP